MNAILSCFKKYKYQIVILYLGMLILSAYGLIQPIILSKIIDNMVSGESYTNTVQLIIVLSMLGIISVIIFYFISVFEKKLLNNISFDIIKVVLLHIYEIPYLKVKSYDPVYLSQRVKNDSSNIVLFLVKETINLILVVLKIIIPLYILFSFSKLFGIVIIIVMISYCVLFNIFKKPLFNSGLKAKDKNDLFVQSFISHITNMRQIIIKSSVAQSINMLQGKYRLMYGSLISYTKIQKSFQSIDQIITIIFQLIVLLVFTKKIYDGSITIGQYTVIQTYFTIIVSSMKYIMSYLKLYQEYLMSKNRLLEVVDINKEIQGQLMIDSIDSIKLSNITFAYNNEHLKTRNVIFENLNLEFKKDNIYMIRGINGKGKSTLLDIIIGLYKEDLCNGNIEYNNYDIRKIDLQDIRKKQIGYVNQEVYHGTESVYEFFLYNFFDDEVKENNVHDKKKLLALEDIIESRLRELDLYKYFYNNRFNVNNLLDSKMVELSGGNRQKVWILRELLVHPEVIFFDEPTSSLDINSIEEFKQIVKKIKNDRIIIIVTHNETLRDISNVVYEI